MLRGYNMYSVQATTNGTENIVATGSGLPTRTPGYRPISTTSAAFGGPAMSTANAPTGYGLTGGALATPQLYDTLSGFLPDEETNGVVYRKLYKDIYNYDSICGAAVDLKANLPFSDFTLTGVSDQKRLQKYLKSVENIYVTKQLPSIAVDYMAMGAYLGSLNLDSNEGIFTSLMSHDLDNCEFQWIPFAGVDPIIDVKFGSDFKKIIASKDPRVIRMLNLLPSYIKYGLKKGSVQLEPGSTLYVPKRGLSSAYKGQSVFKRVLAIHLVEKAIIKGTIEQSMRRQRAILHVTAGDDNWEPTQGELSSIANLFRDADMDPINAIVVTRQGISSNDVKEGGQFWKWEDIFEFASSAKMRALGINEAFLSGDANWNVMETAMSVFLEELRAMREYMTAEIFYDKMFPAIAVVNDFKTSKDKYSVTSNYGAKQCFMGQRNSGVFQREDGSYIAVAGGGLQHSLYEVKDITEYEIPTIHWHKDLKPEADKDYMDILTTLQEQGVPIPLRMWAAAGGVSMDELLSDLEEDKKLRNKISQLTGVPQPSEMQGMGMDDSMGGEFSSVRQLQNVVKNSSNGFGNVSGRVPLLARNFEGKLEPGTINKQNMLVSASTRQQNVINEKMNKLASKVLADLGAKQNYEEHKKWEQLKERDTRKIYS